MDVSFTGTVCVFSFACLFVCTVTDFSAEDKASGVKFCTAVRRRPRQGVFHFGELCSSRSSPRSPCHGMRAGQPWRGRRGRAHGPRVGSACVDVHVRPSPKTDVLVSDVHRSSLSSESGVSLLRFARILSDVSLLYGRTSMLSRLLMLVLSVDCGV